MRDWTHDIERYKRGELTPAEMHALEKAALNDPFLADALEGAEQITEEEFAADVVHLNKEIGKNKGGFSWVWPLRIAASVALVVAGYFLINNLSTSPEKQLSMQQEPAQSKPEAVAPVTDSSQVKQDATSSGQALAIRQSKAKENASVPLAKAPNEKESSNLALADVESKPVDSKAEEQAPITPIPEEKKYESKTEVTVPAPSLSDNRDKVKEVDGHLEISKRRKAFAAPATEQPTSLQQSLVAQTISGKVVSAEDGTPLPGVNVVINGSTVGTETDANGNYRLQSPVRQPNLSFSFIGLKTKQVQVAGNEEDVSLETDTAQLSEVVVVGYGVTRDENYTPVIKKAEPVGGLKAYNRYLDNDARYPLSEVEKKIKGRVSLKFTVKTDGSLDEFKVVKSLGKLFDEEALRMVKE
ncbi:MAG: TonB family protein, partial [Flammeovirgaceae bacterium]